MEIPKYVEQARNAKEHFLLFREDWFQQSSDLMVWWREHDDQCYRRTIIGPFIGTAHSIQQSRRSIARKGVPIPVQDGLFQELITVAVRIGVFDIESKLTSRTTIPADDHVSIRLSSGQNHSYTVKGKVHDDDRHTKIVLLCMKYAPEAALQYGLKQSFIEKLLDPYLNDIG